MNGSCGMGTTGGCCGRISGRVSGLEDTAAAFDDEILSGPIAGGIGAEQEDGSIEDGAQVVVAEQAAHRHQGDALGEVERADGTRFA